MSFQLPPNIVPKLVFRIIHKYLQKVPSNLHRNMLVLRTPYISIRFLNQRVYRIWHKRNGMREKSFQVHECSSKNKLKMKLITSFIDIEQYSHFGVIKSR